MNSSIKISGLNPPVPEETSSSSSTKDDTSSSSSSSTKSHGQRLLTLVRTLEKQSENNSNDNIFDETVDLFNSLILLFSRNGLLQGDVTQAEKILAKTSSSSSSGASSNNNNKGGIGGGGKRSSKKGGSNNNSNNNNELQINQGGGGGDGDTGDYSLGQQQEILVLTAILRVLGSESFDNEDTFLFTALAAELCLAISQSIKMKREGDKCALAEYEIVSQSGKDLLKGLLTTLENMETFLKRQTVVLTKCRPESLEKCLVMTSLDEDIHLDPICSCLKAAASLAGLFGTKLSRSTGLLTGLNSTAWRYLTLPNDKIQESAAKLIAMIPNAGGIDRKTPSEIWKETTSDTIWLLATVVEKMAPVNEIPHKNTGFTDLARSRLNGWMQLVHDDIMEESARVLAFYRFMYGLSRCFISLLLRDGSDPTSRLSMIDARIDMESVFCLIESFLSFSLSAETFCFKTKKRLRNEAIDGGFLSPRAISSQVANNIKSIGHSILDCLLSAMGGPALVPYARRITRISYASLLTSCSGPVRKVIDPTTNVQLDPKRKRWLHLSIPMRILAVRTFKIVVACFGSDRNGRSNDRSSAQTRSDGELAAALVAGCLIEEFSKNTAQDESNEDWGNYSDRVELITQCSQCLKAVLVSCGGFLSDPTRSLIDSSIFTGLNGLKALSKSSSNVFDWSPVKISLLDLGSCSITTPWNDGGASNLLGPLAQTSRALANENDVDVCSTAKAALRFCDSAYISRAPALLFVSRAATDDSTNAAPTEMSAESAMKKMKVASVEAERAAKLAQEVENAKRQRLEEKRQKEQQAKEEKAKKRRKVLETTVEASKQTIAKAKTKAVKEGNQQGPPSSATPTPAAKGSIDNGKIKEPPSSELSQPTEKMETEESSKKAEAVNDSTHPNDDEAMAIEDEAAKTEGPAGGKQQEKNDDSDDDDDDDEEFPDIVAGGPDSDDE